MSPGKSRRSKQRLFVAVDLPDEVRRAVSEWGRSIVRGGDGLRLVDSRNLHLTLLFLGDRPESDIGSVAAAVKEAASPVGGLSTGAPIRLPHRRPRAIALEIHDFREELARIQKATGKAIGEAIALLPESRSWLPHLTVIRLGRGVRAPGPELPVTPALEFEPESVTLYRSELKPDGAEYEALERVSLIG